MRRTEQVQGLRLMKFEEIYGRTPRRELSQLEAATILGVSERTFRRWRDRFEVEAAAWPWGRVSHCQISSIKCGRRPIAPVRGRICLDYPFESECLAIG